MLMNFSLLETFSAFIVLFAVIDIIGSIPVILEITQKGRTVSAGKAAALSFILLITFFYAGEIILRLFHVDVESFAVAGAIILFLLALEMLLGVEIFKHQESVKETTLVPLVFPLIAGPGSLTTLLSLRAEYAAVNILTALVLNMFWVFIVIRMLGRIQRFLGASGIFITRKFFGIILLAIAVRLFTQNIQRLL